MSIPKKIGRYEVERRLGRGGMAVIYLALDPKIKRHVAIKVLPRQFSFDESFYERFRREVEALATLEHPAIVPIYDYGEEDDQPYYVMRHMPGGSLVEFLRKGPLSLKDTAKMVSQIAPALDAANRKSIVHRDIKPGNILFDADGNAYLSDFGIVKLAGSTGDFTGNTVVGTPAYMSPELARGDADIDGRSDIYSLGVLIFRLWAGVVPFTATTPMGIAMKHVTEPTPNILEYKPELPESCNLLIQAAMAKRREDRFRTAAELATALEYIAQGGNWGAEDTPTNLDASGNPDIEEPLTKEKLSRVSSKNNAPPNNLPEPASTFIGRETELVKIAERLSDPDCRLLTLLGPGGIGKTRLSLRAAANEINNFPHGVFFIALAPLGSPEHIIPAIAESIKFNFYGQGNQKQQLINYLRTKKLLLVLDNFEHVIGEATLISEILGDAQHIKILATSRERLNLAEEWILEVHGMDIPSGDKNEIIEDFPAVQLFLERAQKVLPGFQLKELDRPYIVRICQLLEGIPLGIELAAAWVRMLTCEEIASEIEQNLDFLTSSLRNVSRRHRSLRAVFNYSWDLLDKNEKGIFRKLSIFHGKFSRAAAVKVTGASLMKLSEFVDKSLLRRLPGGYYEMLEILRQYAKEKLNEDEDALASVQIGHSKYYAEYLAQWSDALRGGNQKEALDNLGAEIENIRRAWHFAVEAGREDDIIKGIEGLFHFYEIRGWLSEGLQEFDRLSSQMREKYGSTQDLSAERLIMHSQALSRQAAFLYRLGQNTEAEELLEKSISISRPIGSLRELSFGLTYLGAVNYLCEDFDSARKHLLESIEIHKETGNRLGMAIALHHLGLIARESQDFPEAKDLFQQSLEVNKEINSRFGIAISLNNLGIIAHELGEYDEAWSLHTESLAIRKEIDDRWGIAIALDGLGLIAMERKNFVEAQVLFEESMTIYKEIGDEKRQERAEENLNRALAEG